ncbi:MAG: response regulator [Sphingomonadaceae bacterium]|nr:response regulator [Sphingomonadaceae bacterium]
MTDRALLAAVVLAGIASALLLMFFLESPAFAVGFAAFFFTAVAITMIWAKLRPVEAVTANFTPDRQLMRAAIESATIPIAITNRQGRLLTANSMFERDFRGAPTPPNVNLSDDETSRLTDAGRSAWRDGRGEAAALTTPQGRYDAVVERGGETGDYLVWRFSPATSDDLLGDARRLIEGKGGRALGLSGVMAALVARSGALLAGNQVFRKRALGAADARLRGTDFASLLLTDSDGQLKLAAEGETASPIRLVQVPVETGAEEGDPLLFFLLDEQEGAGCAATGNADDIRALLDLLPLGLALADRDGRFQHLNAAFRHAAGLSEDQRVLYPGDLVVDEDKTAISNAVRRYSSGTANSADISVRLKQRPEETVALTVAGARGLGDAAVLLGLKDNSEDEKLKRQVAQATKMQAVGQLAGGVAHDFNNILTAIIGHCDLMLMRHGPGDSDYDDIQQIKSNSNRAAGLTRQLLAFSRQQTLRPQVLQLPDVVSEVSNLLKRLLGETVSLAVHHGRHLGPVRADPGQLEQVIVNLAVNARDAMHAKPDKGMLTLKTFTVSPSDVEAMGIDIMPAAEYTALSVSDTGIGIAPDTLAKIFEPFFTTKEVGQGTGLGLSTVYGIVKQSGGFIFADSELGIGTTFTLYLPVHRGEAPASAAPATEAKQDSNDLWGSGNILVVEDEDMVRAVAERALARQGYQVTSAEDGERALEIIGENPDFDLILSDVVMPGMDGPAMARELRKTLPDVPILFMSGYAEEQLRDSINLEEVHFLPKPFSVQQLAEAVHKIVSSSDD